MPGSVPALSAKTCSTAAMLTSGSPPMLLWVWRPLRCAPCTSGRGCASIIIMIWRWLICSSLGLGLAVAAVVSGEVELTNSKDANVRKRKDYSGVVLWLEPQERGAAAPPGKHIDMLQKDKMFQPHVLAISVGTTVDFPNLDLIFHNAFSNFSGQPFDVGLYPPHTSKNVTFTHSGIVRVFCNIHSTMSAIIAVVSTPWYAVTTAT